MSSNVRKVYIYGNLENRSDTEDCSTTGAANAQKKEPSLLRKAYIQSLQRLSCF